MRHPTLLLATLALLFQLEARADHPSLLLSPAGVIDLKARIAAEDSPRTQFDLLKKRCDAALTKPIELPPRGSNWYHYYVCPKHGNRLVTGKQIGQWQWEHICTVDQEIIKSDPSDVKTDFDGCRLAIVNGEYAALARDLGIVYQVTGDKKYAEKAGQILLAYANQYADYPLHTIRNEKKVGGGKIGAQTLDESTWCVPAVQGADLVWSALSADDRATLASKLFQPIAREVVLPHKMGIHNIQCWKNSAVGLIGFLLDDKELIAAAIDDAKSGYRMQMSKGVSPDGQWWEGAWGYHFYTMSATWPLVEAAKNHGIDLYTADFKRLFDGPLHFARPDMVLPNFSDSAEVALEHNAPIYELAYARWKDPAYLSLLATSPRTDLTALLFGIAKLPSSSAIVAKSANYPSTGYGILTRAAPDAPPRSATWLCLKYGPHGGGHGHPDKLSFVLSSAGKVLAPDAGITSYGSILHQSWYRTTIAHNTLTVDQANQKESTGKCLAFGAEKGADYVMADAGAVYPGIRFVRTAIMLDANTLILIDQLQSKAEHTYDLALHLRGQFERDEDGQTWAAPDLAGYKYFKNTKEREMPAAPRFIKMTDRTTDRTPDRTTDPKADRTKDRPVPAAPTPAAPVPAAPATALKTAALTTIADGPATLITATGPGANTADRVPVIIARRKAQNACIASYLSLKGDAPKIELAALKDSTGAPVPASRAALLSITTPGGSSIKILSNPDGLSLIGPAGQPTTALFEIDMARTSRP